MAIIHIITTYGAVPLEDRPSLTKELATLVYEAEGFAGSAVAPTLCWTLFDEKLSRAFSTGAGDPATALYYVMVTGLAGAIEQSAKRKLGESIASALLTREGNLLTPENLDRIWVQFIDIADGDLIVGGRSTSLVGLQALIAGSLPQAANNRP